MYTPVAIHHRSFRYNNIRLKQIKSNMNADFKWMTLHDAVSTIISTGGHGHKVNQSIFSTFSATCYYYGESLSEELGADAPPLGLVHTAFGGSMIEQWLKEDTVKSCKNASNYTAVGGGEWWQARRPIMSENRATEGKRIEAFYLDPYTFRRTHLGEWVTRSPGSESKPAPSDYYDVLEAYYGLSQSFDAHALGQGQADISPAEIDQLRSLGYIE